MKEYQIKFDSSNLTWGSVLVHCKLVIAGGQEVNVPILPTFEVKDQEAPPFGAIHNKIFEVPKDQMTVIDNTAQFKVVVNNEAIRTTNLLLKGPPGYSFYFDLEVALTPKILGIPGMPVPVDLPMSTPIQSGVRISIEGPEPIIKVVPESDIVIDSSTGVPIKVSAACAIYDYKAGKYLVCDNVAPPTLASGSIANLSTDLIIKDVTNPGSSMNTVLLSARWFVVGNGRPREISNSSFLNYVAPEGVEIKPIRKKILISTHPVNCRFTVYRKLPDGGRVNLVLKTGPVTGAVVKLKLNAQGTGFRWENLYIDCTVLNAPPYYLKSHHAALMDIPVSGPLMDLDLRESAGGYFPFSCEVPIDLPVDELTGLWLLTLSKIGWTTSDPIDLKKLFSAEQLDDVLANGGRIVVKNPSGLCQSAPDREVSLLFASGCLQIREGVRCEGKDPDGKGSVVFEVKGQSTQQVGTAELVVEASLAIDTDTEKTFCEALRAAEAIDNGLAESSPGTAAGVRALAEAWVTACVAHLAKKSEKDIRDTYQIFCGRLVTARAFLQLTAEILKSINTATTLRSEIFKRQISNWINVWLELLFFFGEKGFSKIVYGEAATDALEDGLRKECKQNLDELTDQAKKKFKEKLPTAETINALKHEKDQVIRETLTALEQAKRVIDEAEVLLRQAAAAVDQETRQAIEKQIEQKLANAPIEVPFQKQLQLIELEKRICSQDEQTKILNKLINTCDTLKGTEARSIEKVYSKLAESGKAEFDLLDKDIQATIEEMRLRITALHEPSTQELVRVIAILDGIQSPTAAQRTTIQALRDLQAKAKAALDPIRIHQEFVQDWKTDFLSEVNQSGVAQLGALCLTESKKIKSEMQAMKSKPRYQSMDSKYYEGWLAPVWYMFDLALDVVSNTWDAFVEEVGPLLGRFQVWCLSFGTISWLADRAVNFCTEALKSFWELVSNVVVKIPRYFTEQLELASPASTRFAQQARDTGLAYAMNNGLSQGFTDFYAAQAEQVSKAMEIASQGSGRVSVQTGPGGGGDGGSGGGVSSTTVDLKAGVQERAASNQQEVDQAVDKYQLLVSKNASHAASFFVALCKDVLDEKKITVAPPPSINPTNQLNAAVPYIKGIVSEVAKYRPAIEKQDEDLIAWFRGVWGDTQIGNNSWSHIENMIEIVGFTTAWGMRIGALVGLFTGVGAPTGAIMLGVSFWADWVTAFLLVAIGHFGTLRFMNGITLDLVVAEAAIHNAFFTGEMDLNQVFGNSPQSADSKPQWEGRHVEP